MTTKKEIKLEIENSHGKPNTKKNLNKILNKNPPHALCHHKLYLFFISNPN